MAVRVSYQAREFAKGCDSAAWRTWLRTCLIFILSPVRWNFYGTTKVAICRKTGSEKLSEELARNIFRSEKLFNVSIVTR
jgi:hypothetical protein